MNRRRGNCYVTCEALYHLLGGKKSGWTPETVRYEGDVHWYLRHWSGSVLDPTRKQFGLEDPPYDKGRSRGFLTRKPSRRAKKLMEQLLWQ